MKENHIIFSEGKMSYYITGKGEEIVILHGWGRSFNDFTNITNALVNDYKIIGVDFLGFGSSDTPSRPLDVYDYTNHLKLLLNKIGVSKPIIIAHSFGGRIAINYCKDNEVSKLILVSSAGIRHDVIKKKIKVIKYKILKRYYKIFNKNKYENLILHSGSKDFQNSEGVLRKTLSNVIKYNGKKDLKKINGKVYLLWGIYDEETKYKDALIMKKILKNAKLIPFYNSKHFCYLEEEEKFIKELKKILKEN